MNQRHFLTQNPDCFRDLERTPVPQATAEAVENDAKLQSLANLTKSRDCNTDT